MRGDATRYNAHTVTNPQRQPKIYNPTQPNPESQFVPSTMLRKPPLLLFPLLRRYAVAAGASVGPVVWVAWVPPSLIECSEMIDKSELPAMLRCTADAPKVPVPEREGEREWPRKMFPCPVP